MFTLQRKRIAITTLLVTTTFCLNGCATSTEERELATFSQSITDFSTQIQEVNSKIDEVDVSSENASDDILSYLDELNEAFTSLSELEVPEQYASISSLADQASENMNQAVSYYHTAFADNSYSEQDAEIAYEYYTRAMTRVNYIGTILEGEVPEGENITVFETEASNELLNKLNE